MHMTEIIFREMELIFRMLMCFVGDCNVRYLLNYVRQNFRSEHGNVSDVKVNFRNTINGQQHVTHLCLLVY